ncbi:hypothetical protein OROMI_030941 [Orobanche minor]
MVPLSRPKEFRHTEKGPRNCSVWHFSSKLDVPSNVVQKKRVARILVFKIRPSQEILKIRDGTPLEAEGILTYRKKPPKLLEILKIRDGTPPFGGGRNVDIPKKAFETARPSQEILKIRDGTPPFRGGRNFDIPKKAFETARSSQEILKIRDGTPFEAEGILTYRKRVARILVFKVRSSQEILKIRDGTPPFREILKIRDEILKIRDGTPLELDVPSNVVQEKRVARILVFKIRPSQEILKIRDGTPPFGGGRNVDIPKKAFETARFGTFLAS